MIIPVPNDIKRYVENIDSVPVINIDGTKWFHITLKEKSLLKDYIKEIDSIPEKVWRKYPEYDIEINCRNGNNAERIYHNCKTEDFNL